MEFMNGMVLLQQELNRKTRHKQDTEWSLEARQPCEDDLARRAGRSPARARQAVPQLDRRAGPLRLLAFVLGRPDVAAPTEAGRNMC